MTKPRNAPKYLQNLPPGIEIRNGKNIKSIRLHFTYRGHRCKETLRGKEVNQANVEYAKRKLDMINCQIHDNTFDYLSHFPRSLRGAKMAGGSSRGRTVITGVAKYLAHQKTKMAPSGYRAYENKANKHVVPRWSSTQIKDIKKTELETWQRVELPALGLSDKTINDIFIILRGVFADAVGDQVITFNPLTLIKNFEKSSDVEADPFTTKERNKMLELDTYRHQEINSFGFNTRAGLRLSELLGLAWEDIDTDRWVISISRGLVEGEFRIPKTHGSVREFELQEEAITWLKKQKQHTYMTEPVDARIRQKNPRHFKSARLRIVFQCTTTGRPWGDDDAYRKAFAALLSKAKVRHRGPNQMRHTFASWLLTNSVPLEWIAPIMGTSIEMLKNNYAVPVNEDRPNLGRVIGDMLKKQESQVKNIKIKKR